MSKRIKYTKELLTEAVLDCRSISQLIRKLGLKEAGGTHSHISKKLSAYEINIDHFLGQASNRGKTHKGGAEKRTWDKILVKKDSGNREQAFRLRRALIDFGRPYICEDCGQPPIWNDKELRFQIHHKDGDWRNNLPNNVGFLCPNCHSQTENFCGAKGEVELTSVAKYCRSKREEKRINNLFCSKSV